MLKIPLLVSLGHHGGRRKVASLRPPFSTPLRSLGEPDPDTPFLVPIEHAPPLFVRIREDKISLKIYPAPLRSQKAKQKRLISTISLFSLVFKRRATGEKAPSSAHREKVKSAFFWKMMMFLLGLCAAGHPRQRRNVYRRQGLLPTEMAFPHATARGFNLQSSGS